jgi:superfamily II DNA or RNA helicase
VLEVIGSTIDLERKVLSYISKALVLEPGTYKRVVQKQTEKAYYVVQEQNPRVIHTYQGLLDDVVKFFYTNGVWDVVIKDARIPFPKPDYSKLRGFWHSQEALLREFLSKDRSGLLVAPTRFGKTALIVNMLRAYPDLRTIVAAPGVDLLKQLKESIEEAIPEREVVGMYTGSRAKNQSDDITVCSYDSLHKCTPEHTKLLICDEPHAAVTEGRIEVVNRFDMSRKFGLGATVTGRFDGADILISGVFGPKLAERTFVDAVKEGAILMIKVYMVKIKFDPFRSYDRTKAYEAMLFYNKAFADIVKKLADDIIPDDWQTLVFIKNEKQADLLNSNIKNSKIGMAKSLKTKERNELFQELAENKLKRCVCSGIYSTGVTFPDLKVVINACGGGGNIESIQKPGRLAQKRPDKKFGYLIDFIFEPNYKDGETSSDYPNDTNAWLSLVYDSFSRHKTYKEKGYDIKIVDRLEDIILV